MPNFTKISHFTRPNHHHLYKIFVSFFVHWKNWIQSKIDLCCPFLRNSWSFDYPNEQCWTKLWNRYRMIWINRFFSNPTIFHSFFAHSLQTHEKGLSVFIIPLFLFLTFLFLFHFVNCASFSFWTSKTFKTQNRF